MPRMIVGMGLVVLGAVGYLLAQGGGERGPRAEGFRPGPPGGRPPGREMGPPGHGPGGMHEPGEHRPPHGPPPHGPGGQHPAPPPPHPLELVLDADDDGIISVKELENAAAALRKLDRNNDGQLSEREYRPQRPGGPGPAGHPPRPAAGPQPRAESTPDSEAPTVSVES